MHPDEAQRLFALDDTLRAEADRVLEASGIGAILAEEGYVPVGSRVMRTMTWRDMDFECYDPNPDWNRHWDVGTRLARTGWCCRLQGIDVYREQWMDYGYYWGVRVVDPAQRSAPPGDPAVWKLDLWMAREEEFARGLGPRRRWAALMTEKARADILSIKEIVCREPEYGRSVLSVHLYEAVLEHGVSDLAGFRRWWDEAKGRGGEAGSV
jgi:hypothetical protein